MKSDVILHGCAPLPLAHYLKALGVLRLVSEECDSSANAAWRREVLNLSSALDEESLVGFFLMKYQPTPLVVPWSGNDFFAVKRDAKPTTFDKCPTSHRVIEAILTSTTSRLENYRLTIRATLAAMDESEVKNKKAIEGNGGPQRQAKSRLLQALRSRLSDSAILWIDSAAVIENDSLSFNTLLGGGGGSDGNSHFSDNFMQCLWMALPDFAEQRTKSLGAIGGAEFDSRAALVESLFGKPALTTKIADLSPVLFDSTRVGGPNQKSGFEAKAGSNPWDFIFMLEGSLLFAGALGRKLDDERESSARFPFLLAASPVGRGSSFLGESSGRELWLPIWHRPTTLQELHTVFAEGRIEKHGRMARAGTDAFVAVAQHGFSRGIDAFQRIGFFKGRIGGDNYFTAVDQGLIRCTRNEAVDLLKDVDPWIERLRQLTKNERCPASVRSSFVELERSIAAMSTDGNSAHVENTLLSLGRLERALAKSNRWTREETYGLRPIHGLRVDWLKRMDTGHPEFRLAAALASTRVKWKGRHSDWLRQHLEPLTMGANLERSWLNWDATPGNDVVWHEGELADALNAILVRRMSRVEKSGARGWPDWSPRNARLDDITQFIEGRTDDALLADLLWGLSLIDWEKIVRDERAARNESGESAQTWTPFDGEEHRAVPSSLYALLRLCFRRLAQDEDGIPLVPGIHQQAAQGHGTEASKLAARRLRGSGLTPLVPQVPIEGRVAQRTAAALLFPISARDFRLLEKNILRENQTTHL